MIHPLARALVVPAFLAALLVSRPAAAAQAPNRAFAAGAQPQLALAALPAATLEPQRGGASRGSASSGASRGSVSSGASRGSISSGASRGSVSSGAARGAIPSGSVSRGSTPSAGSISRGSVSRGTPSGSFSGTTGSTRGAAVDYRGSTRPVVPTTPTRTTGATRYTPSAPSGSPGSASTGATRYARPGTAGTGTTAGARETMPTRYDARPSGRGAVTTDIPSSGGTNAVPGTASVGREALSRGPGSATSGVLDLTPAARTPRVRFPQLSGSGDGRSGSSARPTTTHTTPDRARAVRANLLKDQVSRGSILDRYRGPAGRRLDPVTGSGSTDSVSRRSSPVADRAFGSADASARGADGSRAGTGRSASSIPDRQAPSDVSRGRGLSTTGRVENGRLTTHGTSSAGDRSPTAAGPGARAGSLGSATRSRGSASDGTGGATGIGRGSALNGLERVRAEDPAAADRLRRQNAAARRLSDVALKTSLSATAGVIGRYGGFGVGGVYGGTGIGGAGGYVGNIGGSSSVGFAIGVGVSSCWWGASYYFPCWSWCYPYYGRSCYWYGSAWCYPSYGYYPAYYAPIYSTYPVYYPVYEEAVVDDVVFAANEEEVVVADGGGAEPSNPARTEELARAASQYLRMGDHAFREGRYGDAVHFYAKAIEYAPDEGVLYLILSDALFATGDYHYAAFAIRKAAELDPGLFESPVDKHSFYGEPQAFDDQLVVLEQYLEDHYLDDDARLVLATNYLFGDRPGEAVGLLQHPFSEGVRADRAGSIVLESAKLTRELRR